MLSYTALRDKVESNLQDSGNTNFSTGELDNFISDALREVGQYKPYEVEEVFTIESRTGQATSTSAGNLRYASESQFVSGDVGKVIFNKTDKTWALIKTYTSATTVALSKDIMASGEEYEIYNKGCTSRFQINISDILDGNAIQKVEYPVGTPWNWELYGTILTIKKDTVDDSKVATSGTQPDTEVHVWFRKKHRITQLTDVAGAVNNASGYSAGATSMAINGLQSSGTIEADQEFTIANTRGTYRVTADATIAANAATISFYPGLESDVDHATVVTFKSNTLDTILEPLVVELAAALASVSKPMNPYQQAQAAITAVALTTTAIALVAARITQAIADIVSGRTEAAKVSAILDTANTELDKIGAQLTLAVTDILSGRTEAAKVPAIVTAAGTAIGLVAARITQAVTDIASGRTEAAKVSTILDTANTELDKIEARLTQGVADIASGRTEAAKVPAIVTTAATAISAVAARITQALTDIASARTAIALGVTAISSANTEMGLTDAQVDLAVTALSSGNSLLNTVPVGGGAPEYMGQASADVGAAQGYMLSGQGLLQKSSADFNNANADYGAAAREVEAGMAKIREAQASLQQANTDMSADATYINSAIAEIRAGAAYFQEAGGYIQEGTGRLNENSSYVQSARTELAAGLAKISEAQANLQQANANMAANVTYINSAIAELRAGGAYLQEAGGYFQEGTSRLNENSSYLQTARGELAAAYSRIQEGQASLQKAATQLQIVNAGRIMEAWGRAELNRVKSKLRQLTPSKYRTSQAYSRS